MSEVKEIGNRFVKIQFNISLFAEAIWHLATSIFEDHFLSTIQTSITFESINKARGIKKNVCSIRKDLLEGIILSKIWKDNQSPICTIKTSSFYSFCSVFFLKTDPGTGQHILDTELWLSTKKMFKHENELLDFIQKAHLIKDNYESKYQLNDKEKVIMNAKNQLV